MKKNILLFASLLMGIVLGSIAHNYAHIEILNGIIQNVVHPIGQVFLRLLFMIVVPMVFSALVLGVYELSKNQGVGKVAMKTLGYTVIASTLSVLIGVGLVNFFEPGKNFSLDRSIIESQATTVESISTNAQNAKPFGQALAEIIPKNPLESAVKALDGEMLSLMFFALFIGIAFHLYQKQENNRDLKTLTILEEIFGVTLKIVDVVMKIAPLAVFCIVFNTAFKFGIEVFQSLIYFVLIVVGGLLMQQIFVYSFLLKFFAKKNPWAFFKDCRDVYMYAFSTSSSNATLPKSIETAEHKLKLNPSISRFVLTVGATANQNGTALFEGITVLFLAQVFSVDLTLAQQFHVVIMCIIAGIGTAGVPGGSLPVIMIIMNSVGVPPEGIALILGVDRFLDMCRTTLNVSGDLVIAALVDEPVTTASGKSHLS